MIVKTNKSILIKFAVAVIFLTAAASFLFVVGYRLNITNSYPIGIYKIDNNKTITRGAMILFCPPLNETIIEGVKRGYIQIGICPGHVTPLQKKVVGLPGDVIVTNTKGVYVNNILQKNSSIFKNDYKGNSLLAYQGGTIKKDEMFVMSDYNERSFDSRYFGVVSSKSIIGHIYPVILFE